MFFFAEPAESSVVLCSHHVTVLLGRHSQYNMTSYKVPQSRLREAMGYLRWNIEEERKLGLAGEKKNIWGRYREMKEKFFHYKLLETLRSVTCINSKVENQILNLLLSFDRLPLILAKNIVPGNDDEDLIIVVGAGEVFAHITGKKGKALELIRKCRSNWLNQILTLARDGNGGDLVDVIKISQSEETARMIMRTADTNILYLKVEESAVPPMAKQYFDTVVSQGDYNMWIRLRVRHHSGTVEPHRRVNEYRERVKGMKLVQMFENLRYTVLLENDCVVCLLTVFDKYNWEPEKGEVMCRVWDSVKKWPFISFDDEGHGLWFQVGFYGETGWQCFVFDKFFPREMMEGLESRRTIVTGKNIHHDLEWILGRGWGWRAIDMGVWTRDLTFHGHSKNGLKVNLFKSII